MLELIGVREVVREGGNTVFGVRILSAGIKEQFMEMHLGDRGGPVHD